MGGWGMGGGRGSSRGGRTCFSTCPHPAFSERGYLLVGRRRGGPRGACARGAAPQKARQSCLCPVNPEGTSSPAAGRTRSSDSCPGCHPQPWKEQVRNPWGPSPGLENPIPLLSNYTSRPGALARGLAWSVHTPPWCLAGICSRREDPQETLRPGVVSTAGGLAGPHPAGPSAGVSRALAAADGAAEGAEPPFLGIGTLLSGGAEPPLEVCFAPVFPTREQLREVGRRSQVELRCPWAPLAPQPSRAHSPLSHPRAPSPLQTQRAHLAPGSLRLGLSRPPQKRLLPLLSVPGSWLSVGTGLALEATMLCWTGLPWGLLDGGRKGRAGTSSCRCSCESAGSCVACGSTAWLRRLDGILGACEGVP